MEGDWAMRSASSTSTIPTASSAENLSASHIRNRRDSPDSISSEVTKTENCQSRPGVY